jgi:hypothetical protein
MRTPLSARDLRNDAQRLDPSIVLAVAHRVCGTLQRLVDRGA